MRKAETALGVLPVWKAFYEAQVVTAEDDSWRRHDEVMGRFDRWRRCWSSSSSARGTGARPDIGSVPPKLACTGPPADVPHSHVPQWRDFSHCLL